MRVKLTLAGSNRVIEGEVAVDEIADLPEGSGWVEVNPASGWPVLVNVAQIATIERTAT